MAGLFFGLSRAFDSLQIDFLLEKLSENGVRGGMLGVLSSYLSDRKLYVQISKHKSRITDTDIGIPQGSVLGPLLFLLFINDMPQHVESGNIIMFADDTSFVVSARSPEELSL